MLVDNVSMILINHNNLLIPYKGYFKLYCYLYDIDRKEFVYLEVDEVNTISEGYKYNKRFHESQFTKDDFKKGLIF